MAERSCLTSLQALSIRAANVFLARTFPVWPAKRPVLQMAVCHLASRIDNNMGSQICNFFANKGKPRREKERGRRGIKHLMTGSKGNNFVSRRPSMIPLREAEGNIENIDVEGEPTSIQVEGESKVHVVVFIGS